MPKYHVHLYRPLRLYFPNIEAEAPLDAIAKVEELDINFADTIEDCDSATIAALVDHDADPDYALSSLLVLDPATEYAHRLLQALLDLLPTDRTDLDLNGLCAHCGREYAPEDIPASRNCPVEDCPAHKARALLALIATHEGETNAVKTAPCRFA